MYQEMSNKIISPSFRNERMDSVKFWLIFLVILGFQKIKSFGIGFSFSICHCSSLSLVTILARKV